MPNIVDEQDNEETISKFVPGDLVFSFSKGVIIGALGTHERSYLPSSWVGLVVSNNYVSKYFNEKKLLVLFDFKLHVVWERAFLLQKLPVQPNVL